MSEEGEFKKQIDQQFRVTVAMQSSSFRPRNASEVCGVLEVGMVPNIHKIIEDAKKEIFDFEPSEPEIHPDMESDELSISIPLDSWNKHWQTLKKWFGKAEEVIE